MGDAINTVMIIWGFSEVFLLLTMRAGSGDIRSNDERTLSYLWMVIGFAVFFAITISKMTNFPFYNGEIIQIVGLALLLLGVVLRLAVVYYLRKYFTVNVSVRKDHQLITDGFYKYIRHPSYAFSLLTFVGLAIVLNNYISALLLLVPVFLMFSRRIDVEEKVLQEQFGDHYTDYRKKTKKLIPFIY